MRVVRSRHAGEEEEEEEVVLVEEEVVEVEVAEPSRDSSASASRALLPLSSIKPLAHRTAKKP